MRDASIRFQKWECIGPAGLGDGPSLRTQTVSTDGHRNHPQRSTKVRMHIARHSQRRLEILVDGGEDLINQLNLFIMLVPDSVFPQTQVAVISDVIAQK